MDKARDYFSNIYSSIPFWWTLLIIGAVEISSYAASIFPIVNLAGFIAIVALTLVYSIKQLRYGIYILLTELVIGSKGYLFSLDIGGQSLSIRLAIFLVIFVAFLVWVIRDRQISFFKWSLRVEYTLIIALIGIGVVVGLLYNNSLSNIFFDTNGYLYFGLVGPVLQAIKAEQHKQQLYAVVLVAALAIGIKSLVILALFSQLELLQFTLPGIYTWIRDTGVGEITRFDNGFSRIFFQSHIYMVLVFFFMAPWFALAGFNKQLIRKPVFIASYALPALTMLVIFLSYSRSFWVATAGTLMILAGWLLLKIKMPIKKLMILAAILGATFVFDYAVAFSLVNVPLPGHVGVGARDLLTERTKNLTDEPAAATRWQSLDPLLSAALERPVIGSGLGKTVTYTSSDPRVLENSPDGSYTTFAFEWGYLDMFLKFGILGIVVIGYLLFQIISLGIKAAKDNVSRRAETAGVILALLALMLTHVFTPYLNHPLGIGWLIIASLAVTTLPTHKVRRS